MLNADGAVVADGPQCGEDGLPVGSVIAEAQSAENPGAVELVAVVLGVQHAVDGHVAAFHLDVLGVDVEDAVTQLPQHGHGVHPLPDQMAGVEIGADLRADGGAQALERLAVVAHEAGVQLQGNLRHAVLPGEGDEALPVGDQHLIPLVVQNSQIVVRPGAGHPVGIFGFRAVPGAAGEAGDGVDAELFRQQHRLAHIAVIALRQGLVRVDGVSVAGQGADGEAGVLQRLLQLCQLLLIGQQLGGVEVGLAGVAAAAGLQGLDAEALENLQRLGQGLVLQNVCDDSDLHALLLTPG